MAKIRIPKIDGMTRKEVLKGLLVNASLPREKFTPAQTLIVAKITANMLATWYKRRLLPAHDFPLVSPGHGNRRSYDLMQIIVLAIARILIDAGIAVDASMALASFEGDPPQGGSIRAGLADRALSLLLGHVGEDKRVVIDKLKAEEWPLAVIWRTPVGKIFPLAWQARGYTVAARCKSQDLPGLTRKAGVGCFVIIDVPKLVAGILDGIRNIQES